MPRPPAVAFEANLIPAEFVNRAPLRIHGGTIKSEGGRKAGIFRRPRPRNNGGIENEDENDDEDEKQEQEAEVLENDGQDEILAPPAFNHTPKTLPLKAHS
jgi:hypothetical protein